MIKLENYEVVGWEHAIRGMRNPMNSWEKSDSSFNYYKNGPLMEPKGFYLGENDHKLMTNLRNAGSDHRKYLRYLEVYVDITAPLYFWKEFKTYRHGRKFLDDDDIFEYDDDVLEYHIETNSCSTMHKIHEKEFAIEDFSHEKLGVHPDRSKWDDSTWNFEYFLLETIRGLNGARSKYIETKDKFYWWQMIQLLPSSYNQKRTVKLSYECLIRMYHSRKNHKLDEWREFCKWIEQLPYSEIITGGKEDD